MALVSRVSELFMAVFIILRIEDKLGKSGEHDIKKNPPPCIKRRNK